MIMCCCASTPLLLQVAGMSAEAFAASRSFSSLLGELLAAGSAPADPALAWLQQEYWRQRQEKQEKEREEQQSKRGSSRDE
jgi:hypothetical protein